jgi:precorrin-6A synthase
MKKKVLVIGIGAGDPDYVTIQAVNALNEVDVFFLIDKGAEKDDLARLRKDICERYIRDPSYRFVEIKDPVRDRSSPSYESEVAAWRDKRAAQYVAAIHDELGDGECGAFLVWGDPSLYDGTLSILQEFLADAPEAFDYEVIPGISSIQALAARHRIPLNRLSRGFQVTTGRRLADGLPSNGDDVVVMLDAQNTFRAVGEKDVDIYWGAYLGTDDEVLVAGKLTDVVDDIERVRAQKKAEKGWIMDTYLLRRNPQ